MKFEKIPEFESTKEIDNCLYDLDNGENVFLTGSAGTGKTCLIRRFMNRKRNKQKVILAPTGIAALNAGGQTIHSFFRFPVPIYKMKSFSHPDPLYKKLDIMIIDEISMVRSDLFDFMNKFMMTNGPNSNKPFGGVQLVVVGDLYQLPPVLTDTEREVFEKEYDQAYVFGSKSWKYLDFKYHILTKSFRQNDPEFIGFLSRVRTKSCTKNDFEYMKNRIVPNVDPDETTVLCSTNNVVNHINSMKLKEIDSPLIKIEAEFGGNGQANVSKYPVPEFLELKVGAKIIFVTNDGISKRWVNGTIGYIKHIDTENDVITAVTEIGNILEIKRHVFEDIVYKWKDGHIEVNVRGFMKQFPIKLAWAMTIHKSQGLTLENVHLDLKRLPFTHGQAYVALSRCKSLKGLTTNKAFTDKSIIVDSIVTKFCDKTFNKNETKDLPF